MKRSGNIELLRIILVFLIVLWHCRCHGIWEYANQWWSMLFIVPIVWHVDCFVAISGWFGIRFTWRKFFHLWSICAFYTMLSVGWLLIFNDKFSLSSIVVQGGWFTGCYMMLMMLTPLVNAGIEKLHSDSPRALISAWSVFAIAVTLNWIPFHLMSGVYAVDAGQNSLLTLLFVYFTARCARFLRLDQLPLRKLALSVPLYIAIAVALCIVCALGQHLIGVAFDWTRIGALSTYNAPHVWMFAIAVLLFFVAHVRVNERCERILGFLSPSMFGIYLLTDTTSFGYLLYQIPQQLLCSHFGWTPALLIPLTAAIAFAFALAVDLIRRLLFFAISKAFKI